MDQLSRTGPLPDNELMEYEQEERENNLAYERILENYQLRPLSSIIPVPLASQLERHLVKYAKFHAKTRVAIYSFICLSLDETSWLKGKQACAIELGIDVRAIDYWLRHWPQMWQVINLLARKTHQDKLGRVLGAMTDAAITGDNRDRRLYLEYFGHIDQPVIDKSDSKTILFVNNVMNRPTAMPSVVEAEVVVDKTKDEGQ